MQLRGVEVRLLFHYQPLTSHATAASLRPDMDVRYGISLGFHNLQRRVRHTVRPHVWFPPVREVLPLAHGGPC